MKITFISTDNDVACHGVRSISAYIKLRGYETQIIFLPYGENINLNYDEKIIMQVIDKVKDSSIIAFSTMSFTAFRAYKLANALRKLKKPLVIGGIHATLLPEECLDFFDYVCVGEGEEAFLEFIQKFEKKQDLTNIRNLWTKKSQKIKKNEVRNLMESFDFIPDYDVESHFILENKTLVKFKERHFEGRFLVHTSRGCPHSCTYCCNNFLTALYKEKGRKLRKRTVSSFIKEIELLKLKFPSIEYVWFTDDSFFIRDLAEVKEFGTNYKKIKLPFECYVSPLTLNDEKLKLFVEAGLKKVVIGVQTGSEKINYDLYKRTMPNKKIIWASKVFGKYKKRIEVSYQFIITNPYETNQDILDTIDLVTKLQYPFSLATFNLAFFKGTELYTNASKGGLINNEEDTAVHLHFNDLRNHLRIKKLKTAYLNSVLYWMAGNCTKKRFGFIPRKMLVILTNRKIIKLFDNFRILTFLFNYSLFSLKSVYTLFRILKGNAPKV